MCVRAKARQDENNENKTKKGRTTDENDQVLLISLIFNKIINTFDYYINKLLKKKNVAR